MKRTHQTTPHVSAPSSVPHTPGHPTSVFEKRWFHGLMALLIVFGVLFHGGARSAAKARKSIGAKD